VKKQLVIIQNFYIVKGLSVKTLGRFVQCG